MAGGCVLSGHHQKQAEGSRPVPSHPPGHSTWSASREWGGCGAAGSLCRRMQMDAIPPDPETLPRFMHFFL